MTHNPLAAASRADAPSTEAPTASSATGPDAAGLGQTLDPHPALQAVHALRERVLHEVRKVIVGQDATLELLLCAILSGGHVLLEGVPGVAKTLMARALSRTLAADFTRIQFTPDLMPADILGTSIFDLKTQQFSLVKGPIFTDLLLADEINRAPAKTQSALLEAMQERSVSLDGRHLPLSPGFTVFATQNPVESEGTYPLPEAQLDRFLLKIEVGYPSDEEEDAILAAVHGGMDAGNLEQAGLVPVLRLSDLAEVRRAVATVTVEPQVLRYVRRVVGATRTRARIRLGAGPRGSVHLLLASKSLAALRGRSFVTPDDVRTLAGPVLRHRLLLSTDAELDGATVHEVLAEVLDTVEVPR